MFALKANRSPDLVPRARQRLDLKARLPSPRFEANIFTSSRVMLLRNHGAFTLGKTIRRPNITTMTSFGGTSTLATDAMRSTLAMLRGRAV